MIKMQLQLLRQMILTDKQGKVVRKTELEPSHSFVLQFLQLVFGFTLKSNPTHVSPPLVVGKDIAGAATNIIRDAGGYSVNLFGRIDAAIGDVTKGIVVGINTGVTAENNNNFTLDTIIAHGTGAPAPAGTLDYRTMVFVAPAVVGANVDFSTARPMINETIATITVKEIGIYIRNSSNNVTHMILRDVVADFPVDAGLTLTVVYILRTTV